MGSFDRIAREIVSSVQKKDSSEPSLAFSSIEDGAVSEYDVDGNLKSIMGQQFDDGHGVVVVSDPTPNWPSKANVVAGPGSVTANWDGFWLDSDGVIDETIPTPTYHSRLEVHASQDPNFIPITAATLRGSIESPRGGDCVISPLSGGPWYIKFVARSLSGNAGPASPVSDAVTPAEAVDSAQLDSAVNTSLSASGMVQIVSNDTTPPEPPGGWKTGAIWWQTAGPGPLGNTITWHRWDGSGWVEQQVDEAFLPLVNIGTGTFGNLSGNRITLGSVPADALAVGINELIPNPKWLAPNYEVLYGPDKIALNTALTPLATATGWSYDSAFLAKQWGQPKVLKINLPTTVEAEEFMPVGPKIPMNGGDKFYLQLDTYSTGNPNVVISLQCHCYKADGTYISAGSTRVDALTTNTQDVWVPQSKVVIAPNETSYVIPVIRKALRTTGVAGVGAVNIGAVSLRRVLHGADVSGQHAELSPKGILLYDSEGAEVVNLTSTPPNYLNILGDDGRSLASIGRVETGEGTGVYEGVVSADRASFGSDIEIDGDPLIGALGTWESPRIEPAGLLDQLSRGLVAWGIQNVQNVQVTNGEAGLMQIEFEQESGRAYEITIEPISIWLNPVNTGFINIKYTNGTNPANPNLASTLFDRIVWTNNQTNNQLFTVGGSFIWNAGGTGRTTTKLLISFGCVDGGTVQVYNSTAGSGAISVTVKDVGLRVSDTGVNRVSLVKYVPDTIEPAAPADTKTNYTKTYTATASRSFYASNGSFYNWNTSKIYQGNSPAVGGLHSIALFPSMTGDLSGATITSIRAYFYFDFWYYNAGGTAKIMLHSRAASDGLPSAYNSSNLTLAATSSSWPKPGGRWVNIPSTYWNGFKTGAYRGVGLGDSTPSTTEYGYARGLSTKIEIKYSK